MPYTVWYGHANSPVIFEDLVISLCLQDALADLQEEPAESYLVAHDLATGRQRWKTPRMTGAPAEEADAYTTPLLVDVDGQPQLVVMGANQLDAYDPQTGKQLWFLPELTGGRTVTSPTVLDDTTLRHPRQEWTAVGDPDHGYVAQRQDDGTISARHTVDETAKARPIRAARSRTRCCCLPSRTMASRVLRYQDRRAEMEGAVAGPVQSFAGLMQGRVLFLNTTGLCTVVSASSRFDKLVENQLDDETLASPAIAHEHIYLRGRKTLYCIGQDFR